MPREAFPHCLEQLGLRARGTVSALSLLLPLLLPKRNLCSFLIGNALLTDCTLHHTLIKQDLGVLQESTRMGFE